MRPLALAAALTALVSASAPAQFDQVQIKIADPDKKDRVKVTVKETSTTKIKVAGESKMDDTVIKEVTFTDEPFVPPKDSKDPTRAPDARKRVYSEAKVTTNGKPVELMIKTSKDKEKFVLIEKRNNKYEYTIDGKDKVTGDSLDLLDDDFGDRARKTDLRKLIPSKKVTKGEDWPIGQAVRNELVLALADKRIRVRDGSSTVAGKLTNIEPKGDYLSGDVEIIIRSDVTGLGESNPPLPTAGNMIITFTGSGCIDGKRPDYNSTVKIKLQTAGKVEGVNVEFELETIYERALTRLDK